jgi:succinate dehydrogenase / fumarate reductase cytochrome b subunit
MALTGLGLLGFVIAHMAGNLLIYAGPDALNGYAHALKDKPGFLWPARIGLLVLFVVHIILGLRLTSQNQSARPIAYQYEDTAQASWASRHMLLTGLVLLAFTVYHLAHFTFGVVPGTHGASPDVYGMVVADFRQPWITLTYLVSMVFLWLHLWHGGSSWFQSLGLEHPYYNPVLRWFGPVVATIVLIGNCSIPLAVFLGIVK